MAYSKQTWDTTSVFNPTRMNHMEQGIYDASTEFITADSSEYTETVGANTTAIISVPNPAPVGYTLINAYVYINRVTGSWHLSAFYNNFVQHVFIRNYGSASNDITFIVRFLYKKI